MGLQQRLARSNTVEDSYFPAYTLVSILNQSQTYTLTHSHMDFYCLLIKYKQYPGEHLVFWLYYYNDEWPWSVCCYGNPPHYIRTDTHTHTHSLGVHFLKLSLKIFFSAPGLVALVSRKESFAAGRETHGEGTCLHLHTETSITLWQIRTDI